MDKALMKELQDFRRITGGFRASRVILTANNLDVFEHTASARTASEVAARTGADTRATAVLLDAVASLGLLRKAGGKYRNTPIAKRFLTRTSPWYQGDMLRHSDTLWKNWSGLDEVVRSGLPNRSGARHHDSFIRAMHNNAVFRAKEVVDAVGMRGVTQALDLGGGPGTYSIEMARRGASVTLFDLPNTIEIAREIIAEQKVRGIEFLAGDFHTDDIGIGYDLVFISQIFHSLSEQECGDLLKRSRAALNPKGRIAIQEFFIGKDLAGPVHAALFSVNMLVNTTAGRCYSPQEMGSWLRKAGLRRIKTTVLGETVLVSGGN